MHVFVSDLHLGCGDELDDFLLGFEGDRAHISTYLRDMDEHFGSFLASIAGFAEDVTLVLLGDIFDLLQVTGRAGCGKLDAIFDAHKGFFKDLAGFAQEHDVVYVVGNHDAEMFHPAMASWLRQKVPRILLDSSGLPFVYYEADGFYCEHGNQLERPPGHNVIRRIHRDFTTEPFTYADYPAGSHFVLEVVNALEKDYPDIDNVLGDRRMATIYYLINHARFDVFAELLEKYRRVSGFRVAG